MNSNRYHIGILPRNIFILVLISLIIFSLPSVSLASEEVTVIGEWDGGAVMIPVELAKGDRIIGDISIAGYNIWAQIISPSGEVIAEKSNVVSFHVDYVADVSGTISFAIIWLYGTGNPQYNLTYTIYPSGSTQPPVITTTTPPATITTFSFTDLPIWVWLIGFYIVIGSVMLFVVVRKKVRRQKEYEKSSADEDIDKDFGDTSLILNVPKKCKRCKGTGRIKRGVMPLQRGGETEMKEITYECLICGGTGWIVE